MRALFASKWLSSTIRKVSVRRKHRVTDVIWLKLDPELSGGWRMQPFTSVWDLLGVQLTEFQSFSTDWHILLSSFLSFFFLPTILSAWFKNIHFYSRSHSITLPLLLKYGQVSFKLSFHSSTKPMIYVYIFNLYLTRKPINYTCIES